MTEEEQADSYHSYNSHIFHVSPQFFTILNRFNPLKNEPFILCDLEGRDKAFKLLIFELWVGYFPIVTTT